MADSFSRQERIRLKKDFKRGYEQGKKIVSSSFVLYLDAGNETQFYRRLGITVSKRVGNAVIRNRCKRLMREIFRKNKEQFPQGTDIVVVVRRKMVQKRYSAVQEELLRLLQTQSCLADSHNTLCMSASS
jgi:ribonuclease P protein component